MPLFGFLGLGMLRRWVTIVLCAVSFWAGTEIQRALLVDRCLDAGGRIDTRSLCHGLR